MQDLMVLRNNLVRYSESIHARLAPYPGAWRDLRLMLYLVRKLQATLLDTMPDKTVAQLQNIALHGKFFIEMPGPIRKNRYMTVEEGNLAVLMQCAMQGECVMCQREGKHVARCALRSALIETSPPDEIREKHPFGRCEYQDIACELYRGKDVIM